MPNDGLQFDDIARIFQRRDEMRAREKRRQIEAQQKVPHLHSTKASKPVHKKISGELGDIIFLEYSPQQDEYIPAKRQNSKAAQTNKTRQKGTIRTPEGSRRMHSSGTHAKPKKLGLGAKAVLGMGAAFALGAGAYGAANALTNNGDTISISTPIEPITIESASSNSNVQSDSNCCDTIILDDGKYEVEFGDDGSVTVNKANHDVVKNSAEDIAETLTIDERLEKIFENDPDSKIAFNDIKNTLNRITNAIGEDSVEFIRKTRDTYAPNVSLPMLICVFEQESGGRMWNADGSLLIGSSNDTGIGQITPVCEEDVNGRLNPDGKIRVKEDPHDNIEITAISLQDHCEIWGFDINSGNYEANIEALPYVLSAYNAGDGNVRQYGLREQYVKGCFEEHLSYMLMYPEFAEYFGCEDFID